MPGPRFIRGGDVDLHTIESDDLPFVQRNVNDPDVWGTLERYRPRNAAAERRWFESISGDGGGDHLLIRADGDPVGVIGLVPDDTPGSAELGFWVTPETWGEGYALEAIGLLAAYAFDQRRLHKVYATTYDHDAGSRDALEAVGFAEEGVRREEVFVDGAYHDVIHYGLLEDELD